MSGVANFTNVVNVMRHFELSFDVVFVKIADEKPHLKTTSIYVFYVQSCTISLFIDRPFSMRQSLNGI